MVQTFQHKMRHLFHFTAQIIQSKCVSMLEYTHCLISSDQRVKMAVLESFFGWKLLPSLQASTLCVADRHFHSWVEALRAEPSHLSRRSNCVFYFLSSPVLFFWQNLRGFKVRIWFDALQWKSVGRLLPKATNSAYTPTSLPGLTQVNHLNTYHTLFHLGH